MDNINQNIHIKKEVMACLIEAFFSDDFAEHTRLIPYDLRPTGAEVPYRCCIYMERAIIKNRLIADLGFPIEDDDERTSLTTYAQNALLRDKIDDKILTVVRSACKKCTPNSIYVTDLCQGCVARPCEKVCKFDAIKVKDGRAAIDKDKCRKCQMCINSCPYHAIVKLTAPCEEVCPVGAMKKDSFGSAKIDFSKCISCGKCISACPFGAVHEKSQMIDILKAIKNNKKVIALIAPAILGQFEGSLYQLKSAIVQAGFFDVFEVAKGADKTARNEAREFIERMKSGKKFMTTSCCAGYIELTKKHLQDIKPYVSDAKTPLYYTSQYVKETYPDCITVFIGPCVAKRMEGFNNKNVDYVMNFEELGALFMAKKIDVSKMEETQFNKESSKQARNFGMTQGVSTAVIKALADEDMVKPMIINGLNKENIRLLKKYVTNGICENDCNLVEVMCCEGGCIAGNGTVNSMKNARKQIEINTQNSEDIRKI
jgi:[FeFe] hydrogenase (group B1/B3)